jgi:pyrroloquinoline quinone biosynthesis protein B
MLVRVLGSAAGGGFPQWNCACVNCALVRAGDPRARPRTQDSIAFTADGNGWNLVNASPDIRVQIEASGVLHPRAPRHTPIRSILLTNGDLDHVLGLFSLRESTPLEVWATDAVRAGLEERNALMRTLHRFPEQLTWKRLELGKTHTLGDGTTVTARPVAGKPPVHLMGLRSSSSPRDRGEAGADVGEPGADLELENNVALWIRHGDRLVVYAGACASLDGLGDAFDEADVLLFDGTFWSSEELIAAGLSRARAEDMAHLPVGGAKGSIAGLAKSGARRKIFTHINNSNPILIEGSPENDAVRAAGWEVAFDEMEIAP